jgi:uncharacterized protein (TIRG00374 family)
MLGLLVSLVLLGILAGQTEPDEIGLLLSQADLSVLPLALLGLAIDLAARTIRWRVLLAREPRPGYRATFRYLTIGYLVNDVLPGRLGELLRAHLIGSRDGVGTSRALGSITLERGLDVASAAMLGLAAVVALRLGGPLQASYLVLALAGLAAILALTVVPQGWSRALADVVIDGLSASRAGRLAPSVWAFIHGALDAASPRTLWSGLALSFVAWLGTAFAFQVAAAALGLSVSAPAVLAIAAAANLGTAIPSAPAGVGPFEFAVVVVGGAVGLDPSSALLLGLLSHGVSAIPVSLIGAASLAYSGRTPQRPPVVAPALGQAARNS